MDLHPYDGVDRRYRHTDADPATGLDIVMQILGLPKPPSGEDLYYDLSLYSGGIGVLDRLAVASPADSDVWVATIVSLNARDPEGMVNDEEWGEQFNWLLNRDNDLLPIREAAILFVNNEREPFQSVCTLDSRILFQEFSNVNDWTVIWGHEARLNYLGYSQG